MKQVLVLLTTLVSLGATASVLNEKAQRDVLSDLTKYGHTPLESYTESRKIIMQQLHIKKDKDGFFVKDVYCRIKYRNDISPNTMPDHSEINIEHTWPQSRFNKGKNRAHQKADLHHLYPTDSRSNSTRGNVYFGEFTDPEIIHDNCESSHRGHFDATGSIGFEPPAEHKGNVARALFYFAMRYDLNLPDHEEFFLRQWHLLDPVDQDEVNRNNLIESIQGNRNPFIDDPQLVDSISDF